MTTLTRPEFSRRRQLTPEGRIALAIWRVVRWVIRNTIVRRKVYSTWISSVFALMLLQAWVLACFFFGIPMLLILLFRLSPWMNFTRQLFPKTVELAEYENRRTVQVFRLGRNRRRFERCMPSVLPYPPFDFSAKYRVGRYSVFGYGWCVCLRLPLGITPADLDARRDSIAHALSTDRVDVEELQPREVVIRVFSKDPLANSAQEQPRLSRLRPFEVGMLEDSMPLIWKWLLSPHIIVIGPTRSGKSSFLRYLLLSLPQVVKISIADYKRTEFSNFSGPQIANVATTLEEIDVLLKSLEEEMFIRLDAMVAVNAVSIDELNGQYSHHVLLFDEVAACFGSADADRSLRVVVDRCQRALGQIALLGAAAGFHLVLGMQRPDAQFFGTSAYRDQFRAVVALGYLSSAGVSMAFQSMDTEKVEKMFSGLKGTGVCIGLDDEMSPKRFRSHFVSADVARQTMSWTSVISKVSKTHLPYPFGPLPEEPRATSGLAEGHMPQRSSKAEEAAGVDAQ